MSNNEKEEQIEKANSEQLKEELDQNLDNTQNDKLIATQDLFESGEDTEEEVHIDIDIESYQRNLIEGALYASGEPLTVEELYTRLDISKPDVQKYLDQLVEEYNKRTTALTIVHIGDKYQMQIKSEYTDPISQFAEGGGMAEKYLRTLTIIALKQPILKSTLVKIRGSGAYEHVQYLEDNGYIDSVKKGRTSELTTTEKYAETFSLPKNVDDMKKEMISKLGIDDK
jgi:segregation and condensation protein B